MIRVADLRKDYDGRPAVDGVSFTIGRGECFGLLGPNGAGKSTTIGMIAGLLTPGGGDAWVAGHSVRREPMAVRRALGVVPQDVALYPTLTGRENLRFWGRMYGLSSRESARRADQVLELVGLAGRGNDRVEHYSGGMKRRVNIAAGLMHRPQVMIMDEPTVGIDPQSRSHILETVQQLVAEGLTVIYTSHYMEEVELLCHRVAIMDQGRIIAQGTLPELRALAGGADVVRLRGDGLGEAVAARMQALAGVRRVHLAGGALEVVADSGRAVLAAVCAAAVGAGARVAAAEVQEPDLETVFLHLTGRALRDQGVQQ